MTLRDDSRPLGDLRMLLQGADDLVLVVEGVADKKFWQNRLKKLNNPMINKKVKVQNIAGKKNLTKAVSLFSQEHIRFVYDRDFDELINDVRAIPYPGADLEAFLLGSPSEFTKESMRYNIFVGEFRVGLDTEDEINNSGSLFLEDYQTSWSLASIWAAVKKTNQDLSLEISFDEHDLLYRVLGKSKSNPPSESDFETHIMNRLRRNFQEKGYPDTEWKSRTRVAPSGKDVLWIFFFYKSSLFLTSSGRINEQSMIICAENIVKSLINFDYPPGDSVSTFVSSVLYNSPESDAS